MWSLTFREKHRLKILENRLLREKCKREGSKEACKPCLRNRFVIVIFTRYYYGSENYVKELGGNVTCI